MADIKISQLPLGQTLDGTEKLAVVQGGVTIASTVAAVIAGAAARSGHTGTQAISTISGLQAALDGKLATGGTATSAVALAAGADRTKLDSIASGATANATDAALRDRSTHTGSQAVSTITGLQSLLDGKAPLASPTFTGTVSGSFSGPLAGNASTATALSAGPDRTKLDSLSAINQDFVLSRANHTGTQPVSSISGLQSALDAKAPLASPNFTGTVTGTFVGSLSGNASTASGLSDGLHKTKLDGIAEGATVNSTDAALRDRATHTGSQDVGSLAMASGRLIGRASAGAGPAEEITLGDGLSFTDGVLTAAATGDGGGGGPVAWDDITDKPTLAAVALSGSYTDLTNLPSSPFLNDLADVHLGAPGDGQVLTYAVATSQWINKSFDTMFGFGKNGMIVARVGGKPQWSDAPTADSLLGTGTDGQILMRVDGSPQWSNLEIPDGGNTPTEGPLIQIDAEGNQSVLLLLSGQTIDASPGSIGSAVIPQGKAATFQIILSGLRTDQAGDIGSWVINGLVRNAEGTASLVTQAQPFIHRTDDDWTANAGVSGDELKIYVSGSAGQTVKWTASVHLVYVG